MRAQIFLVLALAVGASSAFYTDHMVEQALASAQGKMMTLQITDIQSSRKDLDFGPECKKCVIDSTHWVMHHVIEHIKKVCEETECPMLKKMCAKAAAHPRVTLGWLIGKVRPMSLGYAWCNGKGTCAMDCPMEDCVDVNDELMVGDLLSDLHAQANAEMDRLPEMTDVEDFEEYDNVLEMYTGEEDEEGEAEEDEDEDEDADLEGTCRGCIRGTAKSVMWHTVGTIKRICKKTTKPIVKKMCRAAAMHPHIAFGFLAYKLRPGEWACGYCFGSGECGKASSNDMFQDQVVFDLMDQDQLSLANMNGMDEMFF